MQNNLVFYSKLMNVPKANNEHLMNVIKVLDTKNEKDLADYLDCIRVDSLLYDFNKDPDSEYYKNSNIGSMIDKYMIFEKLPDHEKKEQLKYNEERIKKTKNRFAFLSGDEDLLQNNFKQQFISSDTSNQKNIVEYTLKEKISYYKKRLDNKKLTKGQRDYAFEFIYKNSKLIT